MKADFLKERAESFLRDAKYAFKEKRWFAVAFYLEQASQLLVKYSLFKKIKDFPKTHSIERLLETLGKAYGQEKKVKRFVKNHREIISDLEEAYLTSRYLPVEFTKEKVIKMRNFVEKLRKFLKRVCKS